MPLVEPLPADHDAEIAGLADFFNVTLGFRAGPSSPISATVVVLEFQGAYLM